MARAEEDALRGDDDALAERLDEAVQVAARVGTRWLEDSLDDARMRAAMTRGEHAAVATLARSLLDSDPDLLAILVDALRRTDGVEGARAELAAHTDLPPAALAVARAVVEDDADALVVAAEETGEQNTAAWLLLAAGERYRRAGRRREARAALQRAAALYEGLGAEPWVTRAREELRASGATLRRRDQEDSLTPSERRIAGLAAEGRPNKEVATALFLSPKTVEFHLGNASRKLGVGNRTELATRLRDAGVNPGGSRCVERVRRCGCRAADRTSFEEWARARQQHLVRSAYLLTGDFQRAEDLVQEALIRAALQLGPAARGQPGRVDADGGLPRARLVVAAPPARGVGRCSAGGGVVRRRRH